MKDYYFDAVPDEEPEHPLKPCPDCGGMGGIRCGVNSIGDPIEEPCERCGGWGMVDMTEEELDALKEGPEEERVGRNVALKRGGVKL